MGAIQQILLMALVACTLYDISSATTTTTVYDVLEQNNLPRGLLPQGVQSYRLYKGVFLQATLPRGCDFSVSANGKEYTFRYGLKVGGAIRSGSMANMYGVRVQEADDPFVWLSFDRVERAGDQLRLMAFRTPVLSFPVSAFAQSPKCN